MEATSLLLTDQTQLHVYPGAKTPPRCNFRTSSA